MKMKSRFTGDADDMYNVHGHAGNLCRDAILEGLGKIVNSRSDYSAVEPIRIADFGTADGRASLSLINEMIDIIQTELEQKQAVVIYYNDQPMNNFNLLSKVISDSKHDPGLTLTGNVYPVIIPRTMYEQCLPDNTIDLAISAVATHYLSKQVCQIKNGISLEDADDREQELMRKQGKADWRDFVISRGRELKPGGFLITMNVSSIDDEVSTAFENGLRPLGIILSDMFRESIITQDFSDICRMTTEKQIKVVRLKKTLRGGISGNKLQCALSQTDRGFQGTVHQCFTGDRGTWAGIGVSEINETVSAPSDIRYCQDFTDKLKYSQRIVAMIYPWLHHVIYRGLSDSRTEEEKEMIIDQYFHRIQTFAFEHSDIKPYIIVTEVVIKKNM